MGDLSVIMVEGGRRSALKRGGAAMLDERAVSGSFIVSATQTGIPNMPISGSGTQQQNAGYRDVLRLEALGLMTAGIVHDLGNMIQILSSAINILERDPRVRAAATLQPAILSAIGSLGSAGAMIRQILGFVRDVPASVERVDVPLALAGMEHIARWLCADGTIVEMRLDSKLPLLLCDRHKLENAMLNLVLNARDAMPSGGVLMIAAAKCEGGSGDLLISVADTGIGMSAEVSERAFEPLFTTKEGALGTGLGLATVRQFAQELHGAATIATSQGVGTTVTLRLPVPGSPTPSEASTQDDYLAAADQRRANQIEDAWLDEALADSFPASDPLPPCDPTRGGR